MTETHDLAARLFDRLTVTGRLDLGTWCDFKTEHGVEARMIEPVLVLALQQTLTLAGELQAEVERLSIALSRRTG